MNTNRQIVEKIRAIGKARGLVNDNQIVKAAKSDNPVLLSDMIDLKTSPRLDTLNKFATALGCSIADLIYDLQCENEKPPKVIQAPQSEIDDGRLLAIFDVIDGTLQMMKKKLSERKKLELTAMFYKAGYGRPDDIADSSVADDEFKRALKLVVNA